MMPYALRRASPGAGADDRVLVAALCAAALVAYLLMAVPSVWNARTGANQFQDDAFYYLVPAQHFLRQGRFTFDGVTPTYGFHPLWMAVTLAAGAVVGPHAAPEHFVFALNLVEKAVQALALALCLAWFVRERTRDAAAAGYLGIALLLLCPLYIIFHQGMETTLAVLLLAAAIHALRTDRLTALGVLLALLFLCRLDSGFFVGLPLAAYAIWSRRAMAGRLWAIVPVAVCMVAVPLAYLAVTGHPVPISGAIKSSFPAVTWHGSYFVEPLNVAQMYGWRTLVRGLNPWLCAAFLVAGAACTAVSRFDRTTRNDIGAVGVVAVALIANLILFQKWEKSVDPRYFALPMAACAYVFMAGLAGASRRLRRPRVLAHLPVLAAAVAFAAEAIAFGSRFPAAMHATDDTRQVYLELSRVLPADAVIAGTDVGALAFWTARRVVNLDGVMNDFEYQKTMRDGRLAEYLRRNGVTHIGTALWDAEQSYTARPTEPMYRHQIDPAATHGAAYQCHWYYVYSYVYRVYSDRICLHESSEVFRREVGRMGVGYAAYVVYALRGDS